MMVQNWVWGILAGLVFGGFLGLIKYLALWRPFIKKEEASSSVHFILFRYGISLAIDFLCFLIIYLTRDMVPLLYGAVLLGAAIALVVSGRFFSLNKKLNGLHQLEKKDQEKMMNKE
ncbi:MAG: hypothetical protein RR396_00125 [Clostridiales bacterium]